MSKHRQGTRVIELVTLGEVELKILVVAIAPLERLGRRAVPIELVPCDEAVALT